MGDSKAIAAWALRLGLALALASSTSCAFFTLQLREPGHHNKAFPDEVAEEYHCDKRPLPFFRIEANELVPRRVKPGSEFNHRLIYVLCPERPTAVLPGTLRTRVLFEGRIIVEDSVQQKLRPGRWVLDSFVAMPADVEPGLYAMDVRFRSSRGDLESQVDFIVKDD